MKLISLFSLSILFILLFNNSAESQGWLKEYWTASGVNRAFDVEQTSDGGFISTGGVAAGPQNLKDMLVVRSDAFGDTIWMTLVGEDTLAESSYSIEETTDGGFIVLGSVWTGTADFYLARLDAAGNVLWTNSFSGPGGVAEPRSVAQTQDGGFILFGSGYGGLTDGWFAVKTDANGNQQWSKDFLVTAGLQGVGMTAGTVKPTADGGYMFCASTNAGGSRLMKANSSGDTLWTSFLSDLHMSEAIITSDGGFAIGGTALGGPTSYLFKTDPTGGIEWSQNYPDPFGLTHRVYGICQTADGGYGMTGMLNNELHLTRTDALGNELWMQRYDLISTNGFDVETTNDGGFVLCGDKVLSTYYVIRTDSLGSIYSNHITGNVAFDTSVDCIIDAGELGLAGWTVTASGAQNFYGVTDANGDYDILVDSGTYNVTLTPPSSYWSACVNPQNVNINGFYQTVTVDFPVQSVIDCPLLNVDISTPFLRRCMSNTYHVQYCNDGTLAQTGAWVEVELDPLMIFGSASIPHVHMGGNLYSFNVGTVDINSCGSFSINVGLDSVDCDSAILGQTHCTEARIYPDTICLPSPWLGPVIDLEVQCLGDTVLFQIINNGTAMQTAQSFLVYEDNVMIRPGSYLLGAGQVENIYVATNNGATYVLESMQATGFPALLGDSLIAIAIEGCGEDSLGNISLGFVTQFGNYNYSPYIDIDCQQSIGSYDPNDKTGYPLGYGPEHYIYDHTDLEYHIRFQNTGTDTAFRVVIVDTLSQHLDPATIDMGVSSHNYTWSLLENDILRITFDPIALPDSNVNEPASHGFVRFKVKQQADNPIGTVINNRAGIYFDFNAPVMTNTTQHEVNDNFVEVVSTREVEVPDAMVVVRPNPFSESAIIEVSGRDFQELTFTLYDITGRQLRQQQTFDQQFQVQRGDLLQGIYFYQIRAGEELLDSGKIIVR